MPKQAPNNVIMAIDRMSNGLDISFSLGFANHISEKEGFPLQSSGILTKKFMKKATSIYFPSKSDVYVFLGKHGINYSGFIFDIPFDTVEFSDEKISVFRKGYYLDEKCSMFLIFAEVDGLIFPLTISPLNCGEDSSISGLVAIQYTFKNTPVRDNKYSYVSW